MSFMLYLDVVGLEREENNENVKLFDCTRKWVNLIARWYGSIYTKSWNKNQFLEIKIISHNIN